MNQLISLAKAFMKQGEMSKPMDKKQKIKIAVLSVFSVCCIFLPVLVMVGAFVKVMTEGLAVFDAETLGIKIMFHIIGFFTIIFGMNVIFSEFYFSDDIEFMLPWPVRAWHIVGAKFVSVFFMENVMQFLFVVSCMIGYGLAKPMNIMKWLVAMIGSVTLPILPLAYCGMISICIMGLTRGIRSKDMIQKISVAIMFAIVVVLVASIGKMQNLDLGAAIEAVGTGNHTLLNVLDMIFPNVPLLIKAFSEGSLLALIGYFFVNLAIVAVMLALAEMLYFNSVVRVNSLASAGSVKGKKKLLLSCRKHSVSYAYFMKELRISIRTPAFFSNCIAINFVWPVFLYAVVKISGSSLTLIEVKQRYANDDISLQLIFALGAVGVSVLLAALNSIASNSISREGKHFDFMKYIPVSYAVQWNVKAAVAVLFSGVGVLLFYIPLCVFVDVPFWHITMFVILSLASVLFVSYMGLYIDSIQPKLVWDDEMNALRGNYNSFFSMAIAIAFVAVVCGGGFFLFRKLRFTIEMTVLVLMVILFLANIIVFIATAKSGAKNLEAQEET